MPIKCSMGVGTRNARESRSGSYCEEDTKLQGLQALPVCRPKCISETADVLEQATRGPWLR